VVESKAEIESLQGGSMFTRREIIGGARSQIASAIVSSLPGRKETLRARLTALAGLEIHAETPDGRFIVTVEDTAEASAGDTLLALHRIDEVLAAALVSHYET
jgi:nitrate reductase NapD